MTKKFDIISALLEKYAKYNWFNIVMKMWFRYFSLNHITITISLQCWENVFCPITKSSHFYHNAREMYLVNILGWKCDVEVKGAWNLLNPKSTLLWWKCDYQGEKSRNEILSFIIFQYNYLTTWIKDLDYIFRLILVALYEGLNLDYAFCYTQIIKNIKASDYIKIPCNLGFVYL